MLTHEKHKPSCKIWIEHEGKPVLGKGGAQILDQIAKEESISKAAKRLHMSYRYVWNYLRKIEKNLGEPVIDTFKGGKSGGGGAKLTKLGKSLLEEYKRLEGYLDALLSEMEYSKAAGLKAVGNRLKGKVLAVEKDGATAKIKIQITAPAVITASISRKVADNLKIKVGDELEAVTKATKITKTK